MDYLLFFRDNKRFITFGITMTLFSSFGQTFLISLYVPDLIAMLGLSNASFGSMYAAATLLGAVSLLYFGRLIDSMSLRKYSLTTAIILLLSCLIIAYSGSTAGVLLGLFGLRFAGQGLLTHIALSSMSRYYEENRGKALSLATLGYAVGEAVLPVTLGFIIGLYDWRAALIFGAVLIGFILIPLIFWLLSKAPGTKEIDSDDEPSGRFRQWDLLSDRRFYIITANSIMMPSMLTGLFFYQLILADQKGWTIEWMVSCFIGYAAARTVGTIVSGGLIDKYSALRLFPLYLIPFIIAVSALAFFSAPLVALFYLSFAGFSMGLYGSVKSAVLAEVYGTRYIGSIRSMFSSIGVFSTAISPVIFGWLLDAGWQFAMISLACAVVLTGIVLISFQLNTTKEIAVLPS